MTPTDFNSRPIFNSNDGELCTQCASPIADCSCPKESRAIPDGSSIRIGFESKARKGKPVTTISGLPLDEAELKKFAKQIKAKCSCGGSVKNGVIEIQGDQRSQVESILQARGFESKRSGGR